MIPTLDIVLTHDGRGKLSGDENNDTLLDLFELMHNVAAGYCERVVVELRGGTLGDPAEREFLMGVFENCLGPATVLDGREGRRLEFEPCENHEEWQRNQYLLQAGNG